jgi:hypothetical protein
MKQERHSLSLEHQEWRQRMAKVTASLRDNPHRGERSIGVDGHFRHGVFIEGVERDAIDQAFGIKKDR